MSDGIHGEWWSCESEGERDAALAEVGPVAVAAGVAAIKIGTLRVGLYGTWRRIFDCGERWRCTDVPAGGAIVRSERAQVGSSLFMSLAPGVALGDRRAPGGVAPRASEALRPGSARIDERA